MGLAVGGLGLTAGGYDHLIPYLIQPEDIIPGVSTWYATSCRECPAGCGMVVRNTESRVVKCEGNPLHPLALGTLCARGQAALMGLYEPDRPQGPLRRGDDGDFHRVSWTYAYRKLAKVFAGKPRIALLTDLHAGSLDVMMRTWAGAMGARMLVWEPIDYFAVKSVYGGVVPSINFAGADYLLAFGTDFLENWISPIEYAHGFTTMRKITNGTRAGFAYIGQRVSMTAANADIRIIVPPGAEIDIAHAIKAGGAAIDTTARRYHIEPADLHAVSTGLAGARTPLVLPGWYSDSAAAVKATGRTTSPLINTARPHATTYISSMSAMDALIDDMRSGAVDVLIVYGADPVFALPQSVHFLSAMKKVPTVISLSSYMDDTTAHADWVLPSNTALEMWGDYIPYPDIGNIMQPVMMPLYDTHLPGDTLIQFARLAGVDITGALGAPTFYSYLRTRWGFPLAPGATSNTPAPDWEAVVARGGQWPGAAGSGIATPVNGYETGHEADMASVVGLYPAITATIPSASATPAAPAPPSPAPIPAPADDQIRLFAYPHIYYYDGRNANRRWLQEIGEPILRTVWGSWAELNPVMAKRIGVSTNDLIEIRSGSVKIVISAIVTPRVALNTVAVPIGEGHKFYGRYASDIGVNVYPLLSPPVPLVDIDNTGNQEWAAHIKGSQSQWGRDIARTTPLGKPVKRDPVVLPLKTGYTYLDFYPGHDYKQHRWAMVVDMNRCIGCHACVVACYAENNLGVVGRDGIWACHDMFWLRIDPYLDWDNRFSPVIFQPMLCQQCDSAPCEPVCPVYAAAHSDEGLNMQIYNRCVGTRYCSNNCPYKVRRFNWFDYEWPEPLNWQLNPDVTVRKRGVMEKCTFCIQRIRAAEIVALRENRSVRDGEIVPACVETCPAGVYTFGDLLDPDSAVSKMFRSEPRGYQVLRELSTKPAILYLKKVIGT